MRIRSAGICGSDLHMVAGGFPVPHTLGHEMGGELEDGTRVAIEPIRACGTCLHCRAGRYNLCERGPGALLGVGCDGGMAEELLVPERCLVPLPDSVPLEDACLVEPLAVAVHGLRKVGAAAGMRVAIVGGGSIGLCAVAVAAHTGGEVALVARHARQREAGLSLGAGLLEEGSGEGAFDLVIDAAGTESSAALAVHLARPGTDVLLLATYWEGLVLPGLELGMKEVSIVPSSMYAEQGSIRDVDLAAELLGEGPTLAHALVTHRLPLIEAERAFRLAADRKAGAIKVVLAS